MTDPDFLHHEVINLVNPTLQTYLFRLMLIFNLLNLEHETKQLCYFLFPGSGYCFGVDFGGCARKVLYSGEDESNSLLARYMFTYLQFISCGS
jgi:hypothetical protein